MKIFVTGVNGFIGSHFLEMALAQTDWEIQGFDLADIISLNSWIILAFL